MTFKVFIASSRAENSIIVHDTKELFMFPSFCAVKNQLKLRKRRDQSVRNLHSARRRVTRLDGGLATYKVKVLDLTRICTEKLLPSVFSIECEAAREDGGRGFPSHES